MIDWSEKDPGWYEIYWDDDGMKISYYADLTDDLDDERGKDLDNPLPPPWEVIFDKEDFIAQVYSREADPNRFWFYVRHR